MTSDLILLSIVLGLGILIGRNWHGDKEHEYKKRLLKEINNDIKNELEVATNLNESLKEDIVELKRKLRKFELERK